MSYHPAADVEIAEPVIRELLQQALAYADLPLTYVAHGWDNEIWRLGERHAVRLPRRSVAEPLLLNEIAWLPTIAATVPLPIPSATFAGKPSSRFPYPWAIMPWLNGQPATTWEPALRDTYATRLGHVMRNLHRPGPVDAPVNEARGGPLRERAPHAVERLTTHPEADRLRQLLGESVAAPQYGGPPMWLHGDPHPHNTLVEPTGLSALIDFGDITTGDPASDLGVAWLHFTSRGRADFFAAYGAATDVITRARGWAVCYASFMTLLEPEHPLRPLGDHAVAELLRSRNS